MKKMPAVNPSERNGLPKIISNLLKFFLSYASNSINGTDIAFDGDV
jgi:hypothetical protein